MLSVTHIMSVLVLNICMDANMPLTINSFRQLFPDKIFSPTLHWLLVNSLTAVKFPDISRFSRQVATLCIVHRREHTNTLPLPVCRCWSPQPDTSEHCKPFLTYRSAVISDLLHLVCWTSLDTSWRHTADGLFHMPARLLGTLSRPIFVHKMWQLTILCTL